MPIYTEKMTRNLAKICGATITREVNAALEKLPPDDKPAVLDYGARLAMSQCRGLLKNGAAGLHFYTMNRAETVVRVVKGLWAEGTL